MEAQADEHAEIRMFLQGSPKYKMKLKPALTVGNSTMYTKENILSVDCISHISGNMGVT